MTAMLRTLLTAMGTLALSVTVSAPGRAAPPLEGTLRISGAPEMGPLLRLWEQGFRKDHPQVEFADHLAGRDTAVYGIEMRTADLALLDRPINPFERYGTYEHSWIFPVELQVATDGTAAVEEPATEAVFVRADNPLSRLTLDQLDDIFGAERDGGFHNLDWNTHAARTSAANIRTWGDLGVPGAMATSPLHVYGPAAHGNGVITFFQDKVLHGGAMFNEDLREYPDPRSMFAAMAADPLAIGYGPLGAMPSGFKTVALAADKNSPYVSPTRQSLASRTYPLAKPIYLYFTIDTTSGQLADPRVDPRLLAFASYILGPAGQDAVRRDGRYLPLTPSEAHRQLEVLTSHAAPPERPL